jgi:branched-chain amino acid transport system permease protein
MEHFFGALTFVVLYGGTYGVVLFVLSIGLVMTMGLMRVPNIAHGAFAAIGGYMAVTMMVKWGINYFAAIVLATLCVSILGAIAERTIYVRLYRLPELDQILVTLGLCFIVIGSLALAFGPNVVSIPLPSSLTEQIGLFSRSFPLYRLFILAVGIVIIASFWLVFDRTSFGAQLRASVDNRSMAQATGIPVNRVVMLAFAIGTGLAALGGGIGATLFPLEPLYPLKYLPLIFIIMALTGFGNIKSSIAVAILVGITDTAGRYFLPELGGFVIYVLVIIVVALRPAGIFASRRGA